MKQLANIYSLLLILVVAALPTACMRPHAEISETPVKEAEVSFKARGFDPLELSRDLEVIPAKYQREGSIVGRSNVPTAGQDKSPDTLLDRGNGTGQRIDSANSQIYRVQVFTGLVHGEARQVARVAEEVFDQPVYVDYEVPNYKVRVGGWVSRDEAERYRQKARTSGYTNAWVVMVSVDVRETQLLYNDRLAPEQSVSETLQDSAKVTEDGGSIED